MTENQDKTIELLSRMAAATFDFLPGAEARAAAFRRSGERRISSWVRYMIEAGYESPMLDGIKYQAGDTISMEFQMRQGRADMVIFHMDGAATVVEIKDGDCGLTAVAHGIGQVGMYAAQLVMTRAVKEVRRALMWTSTGSKTQDELLAESCKIAGVIPLMIPGVDYMAERETRVVLDHILESLASAMVVREAAK